MDLQEILEKAHLQDRKDVSILFQEDDVFLVDADGVLYLFDEDIPYRISSHPYEPCIYICPPSDITHVIHNAFETKEVCDTAETGNKIRVITGHAYDLKGICKLLLFAAGLPKEETDISYLEGRMFIRVLEEHHAVSPEEAIDLSPFGLQNHNIMKSFLHAGRINRTPEGKYYIRDPYKTNE